jgi:arylsulfatase
LTGLHSGYAFIRNNASGESAKKHWDYRAVIADSTLESQRSIPTGTVTIGKLLQFAGYKTGMIG